MMNNIAIYTENKDQQVAAADMLTAITGFETCDEMLRCKHEDFPYVLVLDDYVQGMGIGGINAMEGRRIYQFRRIRDLLEDEHIQVVGLPDANRVTVQAKNAEEKELAAIILAYRLGVPYSIIKHFESYYVCQNQFDSVVTSYERKPPHCST